MTMSLIKDTVVFQSSASYHPAICCLIAFAPATTLFSMMAVSRDPTASAAEKQHAVRALLWTTLAIVIVFALVMPKRYELTSQATLKVVTWLGFTWNFENVISANDEITIWSEWGRAKWKFAVDLGRRVALRRRNAWDVLITPRDPKGFVVAVRQVVNNQESMAENLVSA